MNIYTLLFLKKLSIHNDVTDHLDSFDFDDAWGGWFLGASTFENSVLWVKQIFIGKCVWNPSILLMLINIKLINGYNKGKFKWTIRGILDTA